MTTYASGQQNRAALLDSQRRVLERIANGAPLGEILETLVRLIEEQADGMRCAVLLADTQEQRLPSPEHIQLIDMATQMARVAIEAKGKEEKIQALSRQKEEHLRLVIDTIPTMAWSVLPDGAVDYVNQRWLEYTGLSFE